MLIEIDLVWIYVNMILLSYKSMLSCWPKLLSWDLGKQKVVSSDDIGGFDGKVYRLSLYLTCLFTSLHSPVKTSKSIHAVDIVCLSPSLVDSKPQIYNTTKNYHLPSNSPTPIITLTQQQIATRIMKELYLLPSCLICFSDFWLLEQNNFYVRPFKE